MTTLNIQLFVENRKDFPKLSLFASWPGAMINPQWLELPISRTNFHGPKDVRATEVRLYFSKMGTKHHLSNNVKKNEHQTKTNPSDQNFRCTQEEPDQNAVGEDSHDTERMRRLIPIFAGHTSEGTFSYVVTHFTKQNKNTSMISNKKSDKNYTF